ncbi:MAG: hypothetical protein CVU54_08385 [Deltaproteobacteria bacterium HGW-Deltaproteobacteria-12]|jgi:hypothetical protein|nr:MAG: hypothetical protein CVU54_08385 [Deltaproteobacteria bacterium HGW-Deltaproteobacteria-12]
MNKEDFILFSGGAQGAEAEFGTNAERLGIEEINFTFEGHTIMRKRGLRVLNHEELRNGDVSLEYISKLMNRRYTDNTTFRKILQTIWYQINNGQEVFVIGEIMKDKTVKGGTGWGAEFSKICNKPLHVFDQKNNSWFTWNKMDWIERKKGDEPIIDRTHFTGGGTRILDENGKTAIRELFDRSFR